MASSRNGSKTSGLRYLWIPGRKRSHPKGHFDSTNKRVVYNTGQKKSEPWSLGGSKGQKDLLKAEADGDTGPSISGILPLTCAGIPTVAANTNMPALAENKFAALAKPEDGFDLPSPPTNREQCDARINHISASDLISNSALNHNLKKIDEDLEDDLPSPPCCDEHSSSGVSEGSPHKKYGNTNRKPNSNNRPEVDINSIESVSECKLKYSELDLPDGIYNIAQISDTYTKRNKKKNKNLSNDEEDDKIVKCLYYTLMCCDCTIS